MGQLSTILRVESGNPQIGFPFVCLPAGSCCPEVGTATSTECQNYDERRVRQVLNLGNPTHVLRGTGKLRRKLRGPAASARLLSTSARRNCPAGGSRKRRTSLRGLRHRKGVRDLGSCKLRPGDFQAVFVRKRFHKGGYYVSSLSLLGPRAAPPPPFPGVLLPLGQGHPYCPSN